MFAIWHEGRQELLKQLVLLLGLFAYTWVKVCLSVFLLLPYAQLTFNRILTMASGYVRLLGVKTVVLLAKDRLRLIKHSIAHDEMSFTGLRIVRHKLYGVTDILAQLVDECRDGLRVRL